MKDYLDIVIGIAAVVGIIWRVASVKAEIYREIDRLKDDLEDASKDTSHKLELHLIEYAEKKEFLNYRLNGFDEMIKHKFNRCWNEIKEIQGFLTKTGYNVREQYRDSNTEGK